MESIKARFGKLNRRSYHFIYIGVVTILFLFFFTSRLWMSVEGTITPTPIGTTFKSSNMQITLKGAEINQTSETLYIDIGVTDSNVSQQIKYGVGVYDNNGKPVKHNILYSEDEFILVEIPKAQNLKGIQILVQTQSYSLGTNEAVGKPQKFTFALVAQNLGVDDNLALTVEEKESKLFDMQLDINLLNLKISECQKSIEDNNLIIENAQTKIEERKNKQATQTPNEIEKSNTEILQFENSINTANQQISKSQTEIIEYSEQIEVKNQKIEEYKGQ